MKIGNLLVNAAYLGERVLAAIAVGTTKVWEGVSKYIKFADPVVESLCMKWSSDGVGLTPEDAANVTDIGTTFQGNKEIKNFEEFKYFTGVHYIVSAFQNTTLESISIPTSLKDIRGKTFSGSNNLLSVHVESLEHHLNIYFRDALCNPCNTNSHAQLYVSGEAIKEVVIPESISTINSWAFEGCYWLEKITIPQHVLTIKASAITNCVNLKYPIVFNRDYDTIYGFTFYGCISVPYYDFRVATKVPKLEHINAFYRIPDFCSIVIPDSLYEQWTAATNWSAYADKIVKASEFVEPNE